jgi:hypothetical protein
MLAGADEVAAAVAGAAAAAADAAGGAAAALNGKASEETETRSAGRADFV